MPSPGAPEDDLEQIRRLPIVREIGADLRALAAEEDARAVDRPGRAGVLERAMRPRWRWLVGGLAAVAASGVLALALAGGRDGDPVSPAAFGSGDAPTDLQLRFAVFRETDATPSAASDAPDPETLLRQFANNALGGLKVDRAGARVLSVPNAVVVVAPARAATGDEQVCIVVSNRLKAGGSSAECRATAAVLKGGLFVVSDVDTTVARSADLSAGTSVVDGLVPDGATDVRIAMAHGDPIDAPVNDGAISVPVPSDPTHVTFRDEAGTTRRVDL